MKIIIDNKTISELNDWADTLIKRIQVEMQNQGINASGNLSNSLEYRITDEGDGTHIQVLADSYFIYGEGGRASGKTPANFVNILEDWVNAKGISVPSQFKSAKAFAGAIYYNIKTYGSKRHRENNPADVVGPALDEMKPKLNKILENSVVTYINDNLFH